MMHTGWFHLFSTQAALTKTQSTDQDYEHASSVSVAFGSISAKISQGLLWFLNLAYCHALCRVVNRESVVQMNWDFLGF